MVNGLVVLAFLSAIFGPREFRYRSEQIASGLIVGLVIVAGWYLTAGPIGSQWIEDGSFQDRLPPGLGVQSFTFIAPMSETLTLLAHPLRFDFLTFGVAALLGVILGAFVYALTTHRFRFEWFSSWSDFAYHVSGAVLIGVGGVLAMGCTIGQGITGTSTMALGSYLALGAMILGAALSMKMQLYLMLDAERGWLAALRSALADLRLLPNGWRGHPRL